MMSEVIKAEAPQKEDINGKLTDYTQLAGEYGKKLQTQVASAYQAVDVKNMQNKFKEGFNGLYDNVHGLMKQRDPSAQRESEMFKNLDRK